jgi:hypothetical protein
MANTTQRMGHDGVSLGQRIAQLEAELARPKQAGGGTVDRRANRGKCSA